MLLLERLLEVELLYLRRETPTLREFRPIQGTSTLICIIEGQ
jgi:hypothetical protein